LLPGHAAAHCFQFKAHILSSFHSAADGLAYERRHLDPALFDI
jgi:hypothetical protein